MRSIVVAVPAAGFLVPLFLLLLIQAMSVSAAERSYEGKVRGAERGSTISGCGWSPCPFGTSALSAFCNALVLDGLTSLEGASLVLPDPNSAQISRPPGGRWSLSFLGALRRRCATVC